MWSRNAIEALRRFDGPARRLLGWSQYLFMPLAVGFIVYVSWSSRDLLSTVLSEATVAGLIAAVALWSFFHMNVPLFDLLILKGLGNDTRYETLWGIYLTRLPTKYLPGGIWHNVTRLMDLNQAQAPKAYLTTLAILQISVPSCVAFIMGGGLIYLDQGQTKWGWAGLASAVACTFILLGTPYVLNHSVLRGRGRLATLGYAGGALTTAGTWALAAGAFYAYISAYPILPPDSSFLHVAGAYLMAWGTGFISVFTPQGLGVFEATAANLITSNADLQVMIAIIAGFRVVILASDTVAWVAFRAARKLIVTRER